MKEGYIAMEIIMVGISYQASPIEIREQASFSNQKLEEAYNELSNIEGIKEALILDTCNRTEIYAYVSKECPEDILLDFLMSFHGLPDKWREHFYHYKNKKLVKHLYKVATGLESMLVGEDQILGQVKTAYEKAADMQMTDKVFNTLFRYAVTSAKKIRNTIMGNNPPLSISTIAIRFIKQQLPDLKNKKIFVLGVGEMSVITIQNLIAEGVEEIFVANRSKHGAKQLAQYFPQIQVVPYEERLEEMARCDVTISSTSAPHYIVTKEMFMPYYEGKLKQFIDLSIPRDIEPSLDEVEGITVFTLDHLQQVSDENMAIREKQAQEAEKALETEQQKFWDWYVCQPMAPTISFLQEYYTDIAEEEIASLMGRLGHLNEKDKKLIDTVSRSMARKLFNIPILQMKESARNGDGQMVCQVVEELFELPVKN